MHKIFPALAAAALLSAGCASLSRPPELGPIPCTYRFKMLSRPEDQARVEAAIHTVAVGNVAKSGTVSYPEYRFRVARLADLDKLHPLLLFSGARAPLSPGRKQTLNLKAAGVDVSFDSTDVSASATTTITFSVKPGSRLYFKHPGGVESDITAKVDKAGKVTLPAAIKEGQKHIYARAVKDSVSRYIRINIFTSEVQDLPPRDY
jgi:hypothetical protein